MLKNGQTHFKNVAKYHKSVVKSLSRELKVYRVSIYVYKVWLFNLRSVYRGWGCIKHFLSDAQRYQKTSDLIYAMQICSLYLLETIIIK